MKKCCNRKHSQIRIPHITMPDGSEYQLPVKPICEHAKLRSVNGLPDFFSESAGSILNWVINHMDWREIAKHSIKVKDADPPNFEKAWLLSEKEIVEIDDVI